MFPNPPLINSLDLPFLRLGRKRLWMLAWPVRVRDFTLFVRETKHDAEGGMLTLGADDIDWTDRGHTWRAPGFSQSETHPVVGVNWFDAQAFCRWLTRKERRAGVITSQDTYRLPSDVEWSQALGLKHERGRTPELRLQHAEAAYPWGKTWPPPPDFGNYAGEESRVGMPSWWGVCPGGYRDAFARTSPVGSFPPNANGFYDLSGNVWEWCEDRYSPGAVARVTRGGSWGSDRPYYLLSANRTPRFPELRSDEVGFRLVLARK